MVIISNFNIKQEITLTSNIKDDSNYFKYKNINQSLKHVQTINF